MTLIFELNMSRNSLHAFTGFRKKKKVETHPLLFNDFDYEDENVDDYYGIVIMVVVVTMLPTWRQFGTEHLAKDRE